IVGAHTQYLTRVQGMPARTVKKLEKMMDNFVFAKRGEKKQNTIGIKQLRRPVDEGGLGLLDIEARNDAIELMRLKQYLRPDGLRPIWAYLADLILADCAVEKYKKAVGTNQFVQSWSSNIRSKAMPTSLSRMIRAARRHKVQFAPEMMNLELKQNVDYWYHPHPSGTRAPLYNDKWGKCQRNVHALQSVSDMRNHTRKNEYHDHTLNDEDCGCPLCFQDRADGCENPSKCRQNAILKLSKLGINWRPET
ncbi:hypothetical protein BKA70DRAFT_1024567, partial [Coprinopsis sp. MPI-PUGE-AT-0042]